jgi:hypothetical protein
VYVCLTERGREVADGLGALEEFANLRRRGELIADSVGAMSATDLRDFVYKQFPELLDMRWGEEIEL